MRPLLLYPAIAVATLLLAWVFAGTWIVRLIDLLYKVPEQNLLIGRISLTNEFFSIGSRAWGQAANATIAAGKRNRLTITLDANGRNFTLGPILTCYGTPTRERFDFVVTPDAGDEVTCVKSHSPLSWPTPLEFSLFRVPTTTWRRHSYYRLRWKKASGARLEMLWRDEQGYYPKSGWSDGNLMPPPAITIVGDAFEPAPAASNMFDRGETASLS